MMILHVLLFPQKSYQEPITPEFQKKYANVVLELEKLNKDLNEYLVGVQNYCQEVDIYLNSVFVKTY